MIRIALLVLLFCTAAFSALAQSGQRDSIAVDGVEKDGIVNYPNKLLANQDFDFKLEKSAKGEFAIRFYKNNTKAVTIKIYDLIGNLIKQETVSESGLFYKKYDLSYYNPKFFIVEAGNSQYNKTKSIIVE